MHAIRQNALMIHGSLMIDDARIPDPNFRCDLGQGQHLGSLAKNSRIADKSTRMDENRDTQSIAGKDMLNGQPISTASASDRNNSGNRVHRIGFPYPFLQPSHADKQGNSGNGRWDITIVKKRDDSIAPGRKQSPQDLGVPCASPDDEIMAIRHSIVLLSRQPPDRFVCR